MAINIGNRFVLLSRTTVDATGLGVTLLYTVPTGKTLLSFEVVARVVTGGAATPASASIDSVSPGDVFPITAMTGVLTAGQKFTFAETGAGLAIPAAGTLSFDVTTAATSGALTFEVELLGILI